MTIVCHTRKFIFLKTRKTAGSSIEIWLAPHLDPTSILSDWGMTAKSSIQISGSTSTDFHREFDWPRNVSGH